MGGPEMAPHTPHARSAAAKPWRSSISRLRSPRAWLAAAWSLFQLYTAQAGLYDLLIQLPVHVAFAVALGFLTLPTPDSPEAATRLQAQRPRRWLDGLAALLALACAAHYVVHNERLTTRMAMVDDPQTIDVVVGVLFTLLLLEASRRHIGPALVVLALAFVVYAFVGPWLPGFLSHGGEAFLKLVDQQTLTTGGIFGIPTLVSATFIYRSRAARTRISSSRTILSRSSLVSRFSEKEPRRASDAQRATRCARSSSRRSFERSHPVPACRRAARLRTGPRASRWRDGILRCVRRS